MLRILLLSLVILFPSFAPAEETPLPNPQVVIKTNFGDITLRLFQDKSPATVENFLQYVDSGHYNGTIFHRVIPQFMIQGGGFLPNMTKKETGDPVVNESKNKVHNLRGTIAMARTNNPDSATNQFFINQRNNLNLDWAPGKPVFGEVTNGLDIVDFIASSPAGNVGGFQNVPTEEITIIEIKRKSLP